MTKRKSEFLTKSELLSIAAKKRFDYIGVEKKSSLYTTWRARVFTQKGKREGFPESWKTFKGFKNEMSEGWQEGKILVRQNSNLPFSKDNCAWLDKGMECLSRLIDFEYQGETKKLFQWCEIFDLNYNGVRQRYHKGKNYTPEQILFGKKLVYRGEVQNYKDLPLQKSRNKISRMLSAYRHTDKVRGLKFDLTRDYMENNIVSQPCTYCGSTKNVGCDRIDNKKGHTVDNVVPACYTCNTIRNNHFTVDEMKILGKTIKEIRDKKEAVNITLINQF